MESVERQRVVYREKPTIEVLQKLALSVSSTARELPSAEAKRKASPSPDWLK